MPVLGPKPNLDHRSFFSLGRYVNEFIQIIFFLNKAHLNSGVRLLLELYCVIVIKHVAFFTICAKLQVTEAYRSISPRSDMLLPVTIAFTNTFLDVMVDSDLKKNQLTIIPSLSPTLR